MLKTDPGTNRCISYKISDFFYNFADKKIIKKKIYTLKIRKEPNTFFYLSGQCSLNNIDYLGESQ